jgi:FKBP-type peptidyl-prolyl cis-trans isomerase
MIQKLARKIIYPLSITSFVSLIGLTLFVCMACNKTKDGFSKTESGLLYKFIDSGEGMKPERGDIMIMDIMYLTDYDSVLYDSRIKSDSFTVVKVEPTFTGGVEEGFGMMSKGDSALFKSSADSLFIKTFHTTLPDYIKPGSLITFKVRLKNIIPARVNDSIQTARDIENRKMEFEHIEEFLVKNKMDVMPTKNGAYMVVVNQGEGIFPVRGDTVQVLYKGTLFDGTEFDKSTDKNNPFEFVLGNNMIIEGWEECIPLLNKGSVARMVIPSDLGYGAKPYGKLPGYSSLVFEVEIMDVRPGKNHTAEK